MTLRHVIEARVKALAALVASGVGAYAASAIAVGQVLTVHGLEVAAATAVLTFLGVHQAPANRHDKPKKTS